MANLLNPLMQKEMTRQEFMLTLGLATASVFGIGRIIELLTGHSLNKNISSHSVGYSSGDYGGKTEPTSRKLG
jgi:hypothetical protein